MTETVTDTTVETATEIATETATATVTETATEPVTATVTETVNLTATATATATVTVTVRKDSAHGTGEQRDLKTDCRWEGRGEIWKNTELGHEEGSQIDSVVASVDYQQ